MLFDIPYLADWNKSGEYRQQQTDRNMMRKNALRRDHIYVVGAQVLICKDGILRKSESHYTGPYTIMQVCKNGTIRVQCRSISERFIIRRVTPYYSNGKDSIEHS